MFLDWQGNTLDAEARPSEIVESIYDISLRPGILFQPHPSFARKEDGRFRYWPIDAQEFEGKFAIPDFTVTGTRELTAHDYVYALRRLASPRVASPIFSTLAQHIVGMEAYGKRLREIDTDLRKDIAVGARDLPWLDLRNVGFSGIEALDEHTLRIRVKGLYPQFKYWLAMTFVAPIPWEADRFYSQPGMAQRNLSLNHWPVGTGPYMLTESLQNRRHVLSRNPNFRGEPYPCEGEAGDQAAGLLVDCGKMTPFIDRIVFNIEKESIPLQGKFMQGYYDIPQRCTPSTGFSFPRRLKHRCSTLVSIGVTLSWGRETRQSNGSVIANYVRHSASPLIGKSLSRSFKMIRRRSPMVLSRPVSSVT
jgi:ABC-type transport system substrate-binding protein